MPVARVEALNIYPVKSMKGISLDEAELTPLGLAHDRRWMVVRDNGRFVTQRDNPRMALVHTALDADGLTLSLPGMEDCTVGFNAPVSGHLDSQVWNTDVRVGDLGDDVSQWLTSALESAHPLRLVQMQQGFQRPGKPDRFGDNTTLFADAAPYLVANQASLDAVNAELEARGQQAVPMNRFRPNVVVSGLPAFTEHELAGLDDGTWRLAFRGPCERCVVTTIDQDTAERNPDKQPFRTLTDIQPMPGNPRAPAFGQHATLNGSGRISVGQSIETLN